MIASITGVTARVEEGYAIIETAGLGYKVFMTDADLARLIPHESVSASTYLAVREDALDLYGFLTFDDHKTFELLLKVSGIGPRSALTILSATSTETIKAAVATGKPEYLTKQAGVGKKTAEKIVRELAGKMEAPTTRTQHFESDEEAAAALTALGYTEREAREALSHIGDDVEDTRSRLRQALQLLGSKK